MLPSVAQRPRLELSGPKLSLALETLVARSEEQGGIEAYIDALRVKSSIFREALGAPLELRKFKTLCAHMATVRRRIGAYVLPERYEALAGRIARLLRGREDTATADARMAEFCAAFPQDREHRWVRDLAAELLHFSDPERYPLMTRWMWDAEANTGVLREIWHGEDVDHVRLEIPDGFRTFLVLREELAQYLATNGVYRDTLFYVDILAAQVYAGYIGERAGAYLRVDFSSPVDPMEHARRILGLDGVDERGRTRLKSLDGRAEVIE